MNDQAVKAIILENKKVLILKQVVDDKIFFALPGGRINADNFENELVREIKEETNLDIKVDKYIADWSFTRKNGDVTNCKIYRCYPLNKSLSADHSENYENIQEFLWLTANEIHAKDFPMDEQLKKIILNTLTA
jgi:ADP-ribose pyrophosphatase YjhB (NUDIX family)